MIFDIDFDQKWDTELKPMNSGKRGSPYLFPESFMKFMMIWKQYLVFVVGKEWQDPLSTWE